MTATNRKAASASMAKLRQKRASRFLWMCFGVVVLSAIVNGARGGFDDDSPAPLPSGVKVVWEAGKAFRERTATRERICLNGLWQWQPAAAASNEVPGAGWGYFKVPGCWPGITDYMQKDSQAVYAHPKWKGQNLRSLTAA